MAYRAQNPPHSDASISEIIDRIYQEFKAIEVAIEKPDEVRYKVWNVEPKKKTEGQTVYADGTNWDPGQGPGQYTYTNGNWVFTGFPTSGALTAPGDVYIPNGVGVAGSATKVTPDGSNYPVLQAVGTGVPAALMAARFSTAGPPRLFLYRSRNASIGGNTVLNDGDVIGEIQFRGNDGSQGQAAALIQAIVSGTPGSADMPGSLLIQTSPDGSALPATRMQFLPDGQIQVPSNASPLIVMNPSGFMSFGEIGAPGTATGNYIRAYAKDLSGVSRFCYKDDAGVEHVLGNSGKWELIGSTTVGGATTNVNMNLSRAYSEIVMCCYGVSCTATGNNNLRTFISDDGGSTVISLTSGRTLMVSTTTVTAGTTTNPHVFQDPVSMAAGTADIHGIARWYNTDITGVKTFQGQGDSVAETLQTFVSGYTVSKNVINQIRWSFLTGDVDAGTFFAYGRMA